MSKTSTRAFGTYRFPPGFCPDRPRCAARFTPSRHASVRRVGQPRACSARGLNVRLASDASSPCAVHPRGERTSHGQDRCPRRPVKGGGFHDPKRLQPTSELRRARERCANLAIGASFLAPRHSKAQEGSRARSRSRAQPQPNTLATIGAPPAGICKQPKARAQPANIRTSHVFTPF